MPKSIEERSLMISLAISAITLYYVVFWMKVEASGTPGLVQKISTHPDNEKAMIVVLR